MIVIINPELVTLKQLQKKKVGIWPIRGQLKVKWSISSFCCSIVVNESHETLNITVFIGKFKFVKKKTWTYTHTHKQVRHSRWPRTPRNTYKTYLISVFRYLTFLFCCHINFSHLGQMSTCSFCISSVQGSENTWNQSGSQSWGGVVYLVGHHSVLVQLLRRSVSAAAQLRPLVVH